MQNLETKLSLTQERALKLLGTGVGPAQTALAIGVTESEISQLVSDPVFSAKVAELRFKNLAAHTERDHRYDSLEDKLIDKMENMLPYMVQPALVLKAIATINGLKRRGASTPESIVNQQTVTTLIMPTIIHNHHTIQPVMNVNRQVVQVGDKNLVTVQSSNMNKLLETLVPSKENQHVLPAPG